MIELANKRVGFNLYSSVNDPYSHQIRIVAAEKDTSLDIIFINPADASEDFRLINPANTLPTLTDRDLVLNNTGIIMEYLDERYPYPPLMPIYPITRAKVRTLLHRICKDWYSLYDKIIKQPKNKTTDKLRKQLGDLLIEIAPIFKQSAYCMHDEFSLLDCCLLPLLWRLSYLNIKLPSKSTKPLLEYAARLFDRPSFQQSLTSVERTLV